MPIEASDEVLRNSVEDISISEKEVEKGHNVSKHVIIIVSLFLEDTVPASRVPAGPLVTITNLISINRSTVSVN